MFRSVPLPALALLSLSAATSPTGTAQTSSTQSSAQTGTTHRATGATHRTPAHTASASLCVTVPTLSPKIPALPTGTPCPKALFTISERLDAISPLVGPDVREGFSNLPMVFTLAYAEEKIGTGEIAKPHMWYTVNYTGYLVDGTKFDSSYDHPDKKPISFPYGAHRVIPGWDTGFEGMHVGGKRRLFVPFQLAYGAAGRPPQIPPKSELIFDMELVSMSAEDPTPRPTPPPVPPAGAAPSGARPGTPGSLPVTPPTGNPSQTAPQTSPQTAPQTPPQSARPQTGPDVKPTPPVPGSTPPPSPPPADKQPPTAGSPN